MANQSFAVVDEQPQIQLGPVQLRGREGLAAAVGRTSVGSPEEPAAASSRFSVEEPHGAPVENAGVRP